MCRNLEEQGKSWELKLTETNSVSSFPTLCISIFTVLVSLSVFPTTIYHYTKSDEQTQYLFQFKFKLSCVQQEFKHSSWVISTGRYHLSKSTTPLKQIKCCQTKNKRFTLCKSNYSNYSILIITCICTVEFPVSNQPTGHSLK